MSSYKLREKKNYSQGESLKRYQKEISRIKLLTIDEEIKLIRKAQSGDEAAKTRLISCNLRFVIAISIKYTSNYTLLPDIVSEANFGLIKGIENFDETTGFRLISYAVWWIRRSIFSFLNRYSHIILIPSNKITQINKVERAIEKERQRIGREPDIHEVAGLMEIEMRLYTELYPIYSKPQSIESQMPSKKDSSYSYLDILSDNITYTVHDADDPLFGDESKTMVKRLVNTLSKREQIVINSYFGLNNNTPKSLESISLDLKLTRERVRQIRDKAIIQLKKLAKERELL